jgi:hypothetical protein
MHHHVRLLAIEDEVRRRELGGAVVVEVLRRAFLVVPLVLASLRVDRDDRSGEQVRAAARGPDLRRPGCPVAGADIDEARDRIVGDAVPRCAAAAELPPLTVPGLGRLGQFRLFETLRRIVGNGPPAP